MSEINGVQLARLWAKAWKDLPDTKFKDLLEANPLKAAKDFKKECKTNNYAPFPNPAKLMDIEEYGQPGVDFQQMPEDKLQKIIEKKEFIAWSLSQFFSPGGLKEALRDGDLEIH